MIKIIAYDKVIFHNDLCPWGFAPPPAIAALQEPQHTSCLHISLYLSIQSLVNKKFLEESHAWGGIHFIQEYLKTIEKSSGQKTQDTT